MSTLRFCVKISREGLKLQFALQQSYARTLGNVEFGKNCDRFVLCYKWCTNAKETRGSGYGLGSETLAKKKKNPQMLHTPGLENQD